MRRGRTLISIFRAAFISIIHCSLFSKSFGTKIAWVLIFQFCNSAEDPFFAISPPKTQLPDTNLQPPIIGQPDICWCPPKICSPDKCWQDLVSGRHCRCCRFPRPSHPQAGSSSPNGALLHFSGGAQVVNRPLGAGERVWRAGGGGERQVGLASRHLVPIPPARCSLPGHAGHVIITGDSKRVIWAKPAEGTNHLDGVIFF